MTGHARGDGRDAWYADGRGGPATGAPQRRRDGAAPVVDPATGEVVTATGTTPEPARSPPTSPHRPSSSSARRRTPPRFGWVAAALLVALVLLPGMMTASYRRRRPRAAAMTSPGTAPPRPLAVSAAGLLLAALVAAIPPGSAARVGSLDPRVSLAATRRPRLHQDEGAHPGLHERGRHPVRLPDQHGHGHRVRDQEPTWSPAHPDQLVRRSAQRWPSLQPVRRERAPAGVPGRHPPVPRTDDPALPAVTADAARDLLDSLGRAALPVHAGRHRGDVDA